MSVQFPASLDAELLKLGTAFVDAMDRCDKAEATALIKNAWKTGVTKSRLKALLPTINQRLKQDETEWTNHGIRRTFRFWTTEEKAEYLNYTNRVCAALRPLSDNVSFAYGAALAVARDGDLIPHDDDLDLLIAFEVEDCPTFSTAFVRITNVLEASGFIVDGDYPAHRHVIDPDTKTSIDLFVGLKEGDFISSVPGPRKSIPFDSIFPGSAATLCGVEVTMPRDLERYLAKVYGDGWRQPDPSFEHKWDTTPYADLL